MTVFRNWHRQRQHNSHRIRHHKRCCDGLGFILVPVALLALQVAAMGQDNLAGVRCGIDVLAENDFALLKGRRVGLITNHTGVDRFGRSTMALIHAAPEVELKTLFSPEHGLKGVLDERVADDEDPLTGLHVYSLYGKTRKPSPEMLEGLDTLVFDIQDIGARFYTYIATMGNCMEVAAKSDIMFVVLDRPNPITGVRVFGPLNDRDGLFTAYHTMPVVHGMTIGELARLYNVERGIGCNLHVVEMTGWRRSMWLDETLLAWVNPSPNIRTLTQATIYPCVALMESCNVSVGRGTDAPFELFGAPWIDARKLADRLNRLNLVGVRFLPYQFTPTSSKFAKQLCHGVQITLTDRNRFVPIQTGLSIVRELHALFGDAFEVDRVYNLLHNRAVLDLVKASAKPADFTALWKKELDAFLEVRSKYLIYK